MEIDILTETPVKLGESPVWDRTKGILLYVDINAGHIFEYNPSDGSTKVSQIDEKVAYAAPNNKGGWIVATATELYNYSPEKKYKESIAKLDQSSFKSRFNDGCIDYRGRLWISSVHDTEGPRSRIGQIYRYARYEKLKNYLDRYYTPNGIAFSPCSKKMFFSDTNAAAQKIWVSDYDLDQGYPANPTLLFDCKQIDGRPDGATTDTDGCYWFAAYDGSQIIRLTPGGKLDNRIRLPLRYPTKVAFGGQDLKTLFVTSAAPARQNNPQDHLGGLILAITNSGAQGLPQTTFKVDE